MIAPWFAMQDIPIEVPNAGVYLRLVNLKTEKNQTLKQRIQIDFRESMIGSTNFNAKFALIITWRNMTMVNRRPERPLVVSVVSIHSGINMNIIAEDQYIPMCYRYRRAPDLCHVQLRPDSVDHTSG